MTGYFAFEASSCLLYAGHTSIKWQTISAPALYFGHAGESAREQVKYQIKGAVKMIGGRSNREVVLVAPFETFLGDPYQCLIVK